MVAKKENNKFDMDSSKCSADVPLPFRQKR